MAKTVKFNNDELKGKFPINTDGDMAARYADLILLGINAAPPGGFSPEANVEATRLYKIVDEKKGESIIEIDLADFTKIKAAWGNLRSLERSEEIADIESYIKSL